MLLFRHHADWQQYHSRFPGPLAFVPTMGALHEGHLSLIAAARSTGARTLCSIFVNPTQFNDPDDLLRYPLTLEADVALLERAGCDALYHPEASDIYPAGYQMAHYNLNGLDEIMEGKSRPGHFQGVANVVHRLLTLLQPDRLYLGQKDFQQTLVIRRMIALEGLPVSTRVCPILREPNGLAMSSRNTRLSPAQRKEAGGLYAALQHTRNKLGNTPVPEALQGGLELIRQLPGCSPDYLALCHAETLEPLLTLGEPAVLLLAATLGGVRLIDNLLVPEA